MSLRAHLFSASALTILAASALTAHADTVTFSYDTPAGPGHASGTGSFSYNGPLSSIDLAELTSFSFDLSVNNGGLTATFDLAELTSFSATVTGGAISALSLQTDFEPVVGGGAPEDFVVSGLGNDQAENDANGGHGPNVESSGTVTTSGPGLPPSPVPEPSTFVSLGTGILGAVGLLRKRLE